MFQPSCLPCFQPLCLLTVMLHQLHSWPVPQSRKSACCPPPLCPVAGIKPLKSSNGGREHMRVLLSDGTHSHHCLLASQLSALVASGGLRQGAIVRLQDWVANVVRDRK